VVTTIVL